MDAKALVRQMIVLLATDPERKTWEGEYAMVVKAVRAAHPLFTGEQAVNFVDESLIAYLNVEMISA